MVVVVVMMEIAIEVVSRVRVRVRVGIGEAAREEIVMGKGMVFLERKVRRERVWLGCGRGVESAVV